MTGFVEKRKFIRHSCDGNIEFVVKGRLYNGYVTNISASGAFIEARGSFSMGDSVSITFHSSVSISGSEKKTGKIARVTPKGIGVEFKKPGYAE